MKGPGSEMEDDKGLNLKVVSERFEQASTALDELAQRLNSLRSTNEVLDSTNQSTQMAANAIRVASNELASMNEVLGQSIDSIRSAAESAAHFMAQTDASEIRAGINGINQLLESKMRALEEDRETAIQETENLRKELTETRADFETLRAKIAVIPEKSRRKMGL
jgi:ABC-type transporter Mla subunit MlaD